MKPHVCIFAVVATAILALNVVTAYSQETEGYAREELSDFLFSGMEIPVEGLGSNPTIATLREYYSVSGLHMQPNDKYNPVWCGVASAAVPGLGQIICGKAGRGILFLLGTAAPVTAAVLTYQKPYINDYGYPEHIIGHTVALIGASVVMWAWNVIDAAEVAILRDKYNRDVIKSPGAKLSLNPCVGVTPGTTNPYAGLSLSLNF